MLRESYEKSGQLLFFISSSLIQRAPVLCSRFSNHSRLVSNMSYLEQVVIMSGYLFQNSGVA
jgi:hypothetical protein